MGIFYLDSLGPQADQAEAHGHTVTANAVSSVGRIDDKVVNTLPHASSFGGTRGSIWEIIRGRSTVSVFQTSSMSTSL